MSPWCRLILFWGSAPLKNKRYKGIGGKHLWVQDRTKTEKEELQRRGGHKEQRKATKKVLIWCTRGTRSTRQLDLGLPVT
jgi:hypothetical protein